MNTAPGKTTMPFKPFDTTDQTTTPLGNSIKVSREAGGQESSQEQVIHSDRGRTRLSHSLSLRNSFNKELQNQGVGLMAERKQTKYHLEDEEKGLEASSPEWIFLSSNTGIPIVPTARKSPIVQPWSNTQQQESRSIETSVKPMQQENSILGQREIETEAQSKLTGNHIQKESGWACVLCPDSKLFSSNQKLWAHAKSHHDHLIPREQKALLAFMTTYEENSTLDKSLISKRPEVEFLKFGFNSAEGDRLQQPLSQDDGLNLRDTVSKPPSDAISNAENTFARDISQYVKSHTPANLSSLEVTVNKDKSFDNLSLTPGQEEQYVSNERFSDTESVASTSSSIFSIISKSSTPSVGNIPGAEERLQAIFTTNELQTLYRQVFQEIGLKRFEIQLRRLLKQLAVDLRQEASINLEKKATGYLLHRARNLAYNISRTFSKSKEIETVPREARDLDFISDSASSDSEDSAQDAVLNDGTAEFLHTELFIRHSNAMMTFKVGILRLLKKSVTPRAAHEDAVMEMPIDPEWHNTVQVQWKCDCGQSFSECVTEFKPEAAQALAPFGPFPENTIDIEHLAGSVDVTLFDGATFHDSHSEPKDPNLNVRRKRNKRHGEKAIANKVEEDKEYILFCKQQQAEKTLYHADITEALCDYTSYHILHDQYYGIFKSRFLKWLNLKEIIGVDFVKFHLFWGTHVSIDSKDIGVLPPASLQSEYRYEHSSDTNVPVLRTALRHFIQYPEHAPRLARDRRRIPKKLKEELVLMKELSSREGYGLYIQEGICWTKVFIIEAIFASGCILFAVIWCITNDGAIQDGFAIAGTGIAYATILLGALQAVAQRG